MGVLRVNVGGTWVDVVGSGSDEVFIGADDPITTIPSTELWYDTDATGAPSQGGSLPVYATWAALLASTPPIAGSQAWVTQWNVMAVYNGTTWIVPRGTVLVQTSALVEFPNSTMNGSLDVTLWDDSGSTFPFATVSRVEMSGIYMKPDRQFNLGVLIYTNSYAAPTPPGGGRIYDTTPTIPSAGAGWTVMGALAAAQPIAANVAGPGWITRWNGVTGGPTFFGGSFVLFGERVAA